MEECRWLHQHLLSVCRVVGGTCTCTHIYMYPNDAGQTNGCHEDREIHRTPFSQEEVAKIKSTIITLSLTVKYNHHRSNKADSLLTVATYHEQETNDHHGHFIQGHLIHDHTTHVEVIHHVEVIAVGAAAGGGTGRLLHLSG